MKRPLFWASVSAMAGCLCVFSRIYALRVSAIAVSLLLFGIVLAVPSIPRIAVVLPLGSLLGILMCHLFLNAEAKYTAAFSAVRQITGTVTGTSDTSFTVRPDTEGRSFKILVYSEKPVPEIGTVVSLKDSFQSFPTASNEGEWDASVYYRSNGYLGFVTKWESTGVRKTSLRMRLYQLRRKLSDQIDEIYPQETAAFVKAILYCEKGGLTREVTQRYRQLGIAHILAVSGLHVSVFGGILTAMFLLFLRKPHAETASAVVLFLYGALCGFPVSCTRAVFTALFQGVGRSIGRTPDRVSTITASAAVFLLYRPVLVLQQGFWLSFGCAYILLYLQIQRERDDNPDGIKKSASPDSSKNPGRLHKIYRAGGTGIRLSFFLLPLQATFFYTVSPLAPLLNLWILPAMGVLLPTAAISLVLSSIGLVFGKFAAGPVHFCYFLLDVVTKQFAKLPLGVITTGHPRLFNYFAYALVLLTVILLRRKYRNIALLISAMAFLCFLPVRSRTLVINNLSVGQGDCCVIIQGSACVVIDCGSQGKEKVGERILQPFLWYYGFSKPNLIIISHTDADHINGFEELLKDGWSDVTVVLPITEQNGEFQREYEGYVNDMKFLTAGDSVRVPCGRKYGEITFSVLHPGTIETAEGDKNEACLVVLVTDGEYSALFTGDCGKDTLVRIAETNRTRVHDCDYLKVAHHGSVHSADETFFEIVKPAVAVASAGNNNYGHPSPVTLDMLSKTGSAVYVTKEQGRIRTEFRRNGIRVLAFYSEK